MSGGRRGARGEATPRRGGTLCVGPPWDLLPPSSPQERGGRAHRKLGEMKKGQVLGTPPMAWAFQGLQMSPNPGPGSEEHSPRRRQGPVCQRITQERNCQLPGKFPGGTKVGGIPTHLLLPLPTHRLPRLGRRLEKDGGKWREGCGA